MMEVGDLITILRRFGDLYPTGAVGHFHLHFWLHCAIGRRCSISPEFPTGKGRVELHIRCRDRQGLIGVRSFTDLSDLRHSRHQAGVHARKLALPSTTHAVFVPVDDESVPDQLSGTGIEPHASLKACFIQLVMPAKPVRNDRQHRAAADSLEDTWIQLAFTHPSSRSVARGQFQG